ncbi:hypothetical protein Krad_2354 [Kineococcus radiotolerans SRS30216 = ATCC BAA-149]|uniref:DUF3592 domain-containing protein n=2 Tax=Kineococcus radiotolerans TaxID=131568 RepID=A6WAJ5_KINRD|nr:hypothetical protein Krad_2354 [Kineococcus radiotolerans SRS30216 = ATCC BAA-149]
MADPAADTAGPAADTAGPAADTADPAAAERAQRTTGVSPRTHVPRIPRMLYAKGLVLWLVATVILGIGTGTLTLSLDEDLRQRGVTTSAVVTDVTCGPLDGRSASFDVRADVGDLLFLDCPPRTEHLRVGQVVQVTYDPHDVTNVRLAGYTDRPLGLVFTLVGSAAALTLTGWIVLDLRRGFRSAVEDAASHALKQQEALERAAARKRKAERRASTRRGDWWRQLKPAARRAGRRTDWPTSYRGRHRT